MKAKIPSLVICMLFFVTAFSVTGTEITDNNAAQTIQTSTSSNDIWDVQFQYDVGGDTGSLYIAGAIYVNDYFYVPEFYTPTIYKFDHDGAYIDSFTITGIPNLVDLAYDGTYVYGTSTTGTVLYEIDMEGQTLISSTPLPAVSYNVAYDPDADGGNGGFWIGQWQYHLTLVDRSGTTLDTISPVPESMLGIAWDSQSELTGYNGPFLWIFTGTSTGLQGIIKVIDLDTKTIVPGVEHNVALDLGMGIAGGLEITTDWVSGYATLYGIIQGADPVNDYLFGYELCQVGPGNEPPDTPDQPTGPSEGGTGVEYTFTTSTTDPEGSQVYYMWDWGDEIGNWTGPFNSGDEVSASHIWTTPGTYEVKVKAKDEEGDESDWSPYKTIYITDEPIIEIGNITGGLFKIKATIKNVGSVDAIKVDWGINLTGGLILLGKSISGQIPDIPAFGEKTVSSGTIIGLGKTTVTVTAADATVDQNATVLLFFILM